MVRHHPFVKWMKPVRAGISSPLRTLLEAAGVVANGKKVLLHGVDNYTDTLPLEKAMNPTTLIAYEINGVPLPDRHGAPARVLVPGYLARKM